MTINEKMLNTKGRILIIDDEQDVRDVLKLHLEQGGYMVIEAGDGAEGIQMMKKGSNLLQVGLILCDIRMPRVNGVETIEYIRSNAPSIPIMVVTGYPDAELAVSLMEKGVRDYVVKPVEKEKLLSKVAAILSEEQNFQYV